MQEIILYTNNCPKCKILKEKLDENNIEYTICSDIKKMFSKGFRSAPMLEIDNKSLTYSEAINWIQERN